MTADEGTCGITVEEADSGVEVTGEEPGREACAEVEASRVREHPRPVLVGGPLALARVCGLRPELEGGAPPPAHRPPPAKGLALEVSGLSAAVVLASVCLMLGTMSG